MREPTTRHRRRFENKVERQIRKDLRCLVQQLAQEDAAGAVADERDAGNRGFGLQLPVQLAQESDATRCRAVE